MTYEEYMALSDRLYFEEEYSNMSPKTFKWFHDNRERIEIFKALKNGYNFVKSYNNTDIYEKDGKFVPYLGCHYCFTTIEDCMRRIDGK